MPRIFLLLLVAGIFPFPRVAMSVEPLHEWKFANSHWAGTAISEQAKALSAEVSSKPRFASDGSWLTGKSNYIAIKGVSPASLPSDGVTVEADVIIKKGQKWGSIISYAQDNGSYERGWLLGYNERSFLFWVSTGGALQQIVADVPFQVGERYRVTGTYDGTKLKLYVDGKLAGSLPHGGKLSYPEWAYYAIGVYKDEDENYPMEGSLFSASVFDGVLTENQVRSRSGLGPAPKPIRYTSRPILKFTGKGKARIEWGTVLKAGGAVAYGEGDELDRVIESNYHDGIHTVTLEGLSHATNYSYRIVQQSATNQMLSPVYEFNTSLNFSSFHEQVKKPSVPLSEAAAIIEATEIDRGYCLVIGASRSEMILDLSKYSQMSIFVMESEELKIAAIRKLLYEKGIYGSRVSVLEVDDISASIPLTSCMVNLLVSLDRENDSEIKRVLVPGRGKAIFLKQGGRMFARERFVDSGEWTHQYGDPGNTASSEDSLGGATGTGDFAVQWVGRPGADFGIDRNPRMPAPVSCAGRLFHQGMNRLIGLDSNNGAVLWAAEIPDLRRVNIPRDCGNWCADTNALYVAVREQAFVMNAETGERTQVLQVLPGELEEKGYQWGYIGRIGGSLLGSAVKEETGYTSFWSKKMWFDGKGAGDGTAQVCSDSLFSYTIHKSRAEPAWVYKQGVIFNSTISALGGCVYFVETRNEEVLTSSRRRLSGAGIWKNQYLVALDADTGKLVWEKAIDTEDGTLAFYLQASSEGLLLTASNKEFHLYAFDPSSGVSLWDRSVPWADDHHSGHIQHPVITGGNVYLQPNGYRLRTGEIITKKVGRREGCHTYVGAGGALIYRGKSRQISMWDKKTESVSSWPRLRPSCWLNTIPASGMLLVPEGGGGCSCGGWMETSIGFLPKSRLGGVK